MKVIYQGQLWSVAGDDGDGLILVSMGEPEIRTYALYSSEGLVIDPTDGDVEAVTWLASRDYRPAAKNDR
jgi:hypothetical protein